VDASKCILLGGFTNARSNAPTSAWRAVVEA
jgi:hypothetical protein